MAESDPRLMNYMRLRQLVGWLGLLLPVVLIGGGLFIDMAFRPTLSSYYYSDLRDVFVGTLFAIGTFLITYRYERADDIVTTIAGFAAYAVALFPTSADDCLDFWSAGLPAQIHVIAAAIFLGALGVMSLFLFTRSAGVKTPMKRRRNGVYVAAGLTIFVCLGVIADEFTTVERCPAEDLPDRFVILAAEAVAVIAFGLSWLVKGEFMLGDR
ncbi:hypothetical protein [Notoacmeibacter sp. MSK16QG-6]|uniref:hypothetical protein n=1 Tax=Notoacmeibacter sp. MSK16QG-6 TaxID=2957982 RepID=UPI00209CB701|nr:hypothetical protein [Notoacmeibacter sp. MSK16QG-6]MCP1198828.1 hypothetical protein [Notoacmeibacter sp. MSK16QG-6]